jgi:DNA invertase Pin-like site-specific DNA recombinase
VAVEFVKEKLTFRGFDAPMDTLMMTLLSAIAQFERSLIRERQREGIELAKSRGVYTGRKPSLTPERAAALRARVKAGGSKAAIARDFGISRETLYKYLKQKDARRESRHLRA